MDFTEQPPQPQGSSPGRVLAWGESGYDSEHKEGLSDWTKTKLEFF